MDVGRPAECTDAIECTEVLRWGREGARLAVHISFSNLIKDGKRSSSSEKCVGSGSATPARANQCRRLYEK
jgi:hypothetical protein